MTDAEVFEIGHYDVFSRSPLDRNEPPDSLISNVFFIWKAALWLWRDTCQHRENELSGRRARA